jgi:spore cortex formation protein SpoVR/YcgB (stage V sporulation)
MGSIQPNIQVFNVDRKGDRSLTLRNTQYNRMPLHNIINEVLKHLVRLWGFKVRLETVENDHIIMPLYECEK